MTPVSTEPRLIWVVTKGLTRLLFLKADLCWYSWYTTVNLRQYYRLRRNFVSAAWTGCRTCQVTDIRRWSTSGRWPENSSASSASNTLLATLTSNYWHTSRFSMQQPGADPGICVRGRPSPFPLLPLISPSLLLPSLLFPLPSSLPLRSRSPLNQLGGLGETCKPPQRGPRRSPGRKRIWCILMLWESHWWQSFWIFWRACFTVGWSKFSTS